MANRTDPKNNTSTTKTPTDLGVRLQAEWERLAHRPVAVARANGWDLAAGRFDSLDELVAACGHANRGDPRAAALAVDEGANELFGRLLVIATTDELAARVALQRMLPGLGMLARRYGHNPQMSFDELVAIAWSVIRRFNHARRRPRYFAPTLLRDCHYEAYGRAVRRRLVAVVTPPDSLDELAAGVGEGEPIDELLDLIADGRRAGLLSVDDMASLAASLRGETSSVVAGRLKISERTLRTRRADLIRRLRRVAMSTAAA